MKPLGENTPSLPNMLSLGTSQNSAHHLSGDRNDPLFKNNTNGHSQGTLSAILPDTFYNGFKAASYTFPIGSHPASITMNGSDAAKFTDLATAAAIGQKIVAMDKKIDLGGVAARADVRTLLYNPPTQIKKEKGTLRPNVDTEDESEAATSYSSDSEFEDKEKVLVRKWERDRCDVAWRFNWLQFKTKELQRDLAHCERVHAQLRERKQKLVPNFKEEDGPWHSLRTSGFKEVVRKRTLVKNVSNNSRFELGKQGKHPLFNIKAKKRRRRGNQDTGFSPSKKPKVEGPKPRYSKKGGTLHSPAASPVQQPLSPRAQRLRREKRNTSSEMLFHDENTIIIPYSLCSPSTLSQVIPPSTPKEIHTPNWHLIQGRDIDGAFEKEIQRMSLEKRKLDLHRTRLACINQQQEKECKTLLQWASDFLMEDPDEPSPILEHPQPRSDCLPISSTHRDSSSGQKPPEQNEHQKAQSPGLDASSGSSPGSVIPETQDPMQIEPQLSSMNEDKDPLASSIEQPSLSSTSSPAQSLLSISQPFDCPDRSTQSQTCEFSSEETTDDEVYAERHFAEELLERKKFFFPLPRHFPRGPEDIPREFFITYRRVPKKVQKKDRLEEEIEMKKRFIKRKFKKIRSRYTCGKDNFKTWSDLDEFDWDYSDMSSDSDDELLNSEPISLWDVVEKPPMIDPETKQEKIIICLRKRPQGAVR